MSKANHSTLKVGNVELSRDEVFEILREGGAYTPVFGPADKRIEPSELQDINEIEKEMCDKGIIINEDVWQKSSGIKNAKKMYTFNRNDRRHCTLIATRLAYTKYHKVNKQYLNEQYFIKAKGFPRDNDNYVVRITTPHKGDLYLWSPKDGGEGTSNEPYEFSIGYAYDNKNITSDFEKILVLAERARDDVGGVLLQIAQDDKKSSIPATNNKKNGKLSGPQAMEAFRNGALKDQTSLQNTFEQAKLYLESFLNNAKYIKLKLQIKNKQNAKDLVKKILNDTRPTPEFRLTPTPSRSVSPFSLPPSKRERPLLVGS